MNNIDKVKDSFRKMDELLYESEKEFSDLKKFAQQFKEFAKKAKELEAFYHSEDWMNGRELIYKDSENKESFYSAAEDPIWNLLQAFHQEKIQLVKLISKHL